MSTKHVAFKPKQLEANPFNYKHAGSSLIPCTCAHARTQRTGRVSVGTPAPPSLFQQGQRGEGAGSAEEHIPCMCEGPTHQIKNQKATASLGDGQANGQATSQGRNQSWMWRESAGPEQESQDSGEGFACMWQSQIESRHHNGL